MAQPGNVPGAPAPHTHALSSAYVWMWMWCRACCQLPVLLLTSRQEYLEDLQVSDMPEPMILSRFEEACDSRVSIGFSAFFFFWEYHFCSWSKGGEAACAERSRASALWKRLQSFPRRISIPQRSVRLGPVSCATSSARISGGR